ncbi:Hsp70 family protein [Rhodococcus indonesiensis]|uniref:Hsp70 family protein n=1 Tax=Rhodococcus indonesiensis TaxID=3055869 RepID=UPI0039F68013
MTSVLGVSVGASAVRFACRDAESPDGPIFRSRSVTATLERPGDPTAESLETVLTETDEIDEVDAIGVAYRNQAQAGAVQAAMARLEIGNFHLVPEVTAALEMLETSGGLGDHETLVFYDLGSSGLTVTVVDRTTGIVLSTARSDQISGDLVDRLIYDHHLALHRFTQPDDTAAQLALAARCRDAKEQLSTKGAVCVPGDGGLLLLSQDNFDSLIDSPVKASARLTREVIRRSGRTPDAAVLIGGGANIPLVTSVMESWLELPVIVPAQPELVAAEGAALLARPATGAVVLPTEVTAPHETSDTVDTRHTVDTTAPSRKRRRLLLAGSVVTAVAAIGLGTALLQGSDADPTVTQESTQAPARQAVLPQPTKIPAVAPPPGSTPPVAGTQPPATSQSDGRTVDQPQTQSTTQAPFTPQTQNSAPADASAPAPPPEPAPLVPGLPQFQLPTLPPPPPPLPLPELPRIPGL